MNTTKDQQTDRLNREEGQALKLLLIGADVGQVSWCGPGELMTEVEQVCGDQGPEQSHAQPTNTTKQTPITDYQ